MGRYHRSGALVVTFVLFALATTGCVFLDEGRRQDFRGPSWEVPLAVPLFAKQTRQLVDMVDFEVSDEDGTLGYRETLERVEFEVPPGVTVPEFAFEPQTVEIDLVDWPDLDEIDLLADVVLNLRIVNDVGLDGRLNVKIEGLSDGDVEKVKRREERFDGDKSVSLNLTEILQAKPDKLRFTMGASLKTGSAPGEGGRIAVVPEVWVPIVLEIGPEGQDVPIGEAVALDLDEDTRTAIREAPLGEVALIVDVDTRLPFGVELELAFEPSAAGSGPGSGPGSSSGLGSGSSSGSESGHTSGSGLGSSSGSGSGSTPGSGATSGTGLGPAKAALHLSLPPAPTDGQGRTADAENHVVELVVNEAVRSALVREGTVMKATLTVHGSKDRGLVRMHKDDYIAFRSYAKVTALVNRP